LPTFHSLTYSLFISRTKILRKSKNCLLINFFGLNLNQKKSNFNLKRRVNHEKSCNCWKQWKSICERCIE